MDVRSFVRTLAVAGALTTLAPTAAVHAEERLDDAALRGRIEAAIEALNFGDGSRIRVAVQDGEVILQGTVRLLEHSLRAEQTAWKTEGVEDVDNELRIVSPSGSADAVIEREVRMIIKNDVRFTDTSLELEVAGGVVRLRGLFQDPSGVLALKHRIASIPGVLDVEIDAVLVALAPTSLATEGLWVIL